MRWNMKSEKERRKGEKRSRRRKDSDVNFSSM